MVDQSVSFQLTDGNKFKFKFKNISGKENTYFLYLPPFLYVTACIYKHLG